jgi:hypothetical protein
MSAGAVDGGAVAVIPPIAFMEQMLLLLEA